MLQEAQCASSSDNETPHVGDIEKAGVPARGQVLLHDAAGVVQRHVPAGEVDHPGAQGDMSAVKDRLLRLAHHSIHSFDPKGCSPARSAPNMRQAMWT